MRTPDSGFESMEQRFESSSGCIPFLLLAVPLIPYVLSQSPSAGAAGITVGVAVAAGAWITWMVILHPGWTQRPAGDGGLHHWADRVQRRAHHPQPLVRVLHLVRLPARHALSDPGLAVGRRGAAVAIFFAMAQAGGFHRPTVSTVAIWVLLAGVDVVLVGAFTLLGVGSEEQNQARKQMILELAEANQRLEEMMAENTGLQAQLLVQAREAGAGDERQRMAREIHDTLAQGLTGIITQLEAAQQTTNNVEREDGGSATRNASPATAWLKPAARSRRCGRSALEDSRLPEALADEVARWCATSGAGRRGRDHRRGAGAAPRGRGQQPARGAGGTGQRGQARRRLTGRGHALLHGGRGEPRRARRRRRVHPAAAVQREQGQREQVNGAAGRRAASA